MPAATWHGRVFDGVWAVGAYRRHELYGLLERGIVGGRRLQLREVEVAEGDGAALLHEACRDFLAHAIGTSGDDREVPFKLHGSQRRRFFSALGFSLFLAPRATGAR